MEKSSPEEIRRELAAIRADIDRLGAVPAVPTIFAKDHSKWSAHGDWSSGSKMLDGRFSHSSELSSIPSTPLQLDKILIDASSERLIAVAKSLSDLLVEK